MYNKNTNQKQYYKFVSRKNKYSDKNVTLRYEDSIITDDERCANIFSDFFSSVFTTGESNTNVDMSKIPNYPEMPDIEIQEPTIREALEHLDTSESTGSDEIPALILKKFAHIFLPILSIIFRRSYAEGLVPKE